MKGTYPLVKRVEVFDGGFTVVCDAGVWLKISEDDEQARRQQKAKKLADDYFSTFPVVFPPGDWRMTDNTIPATATMPYSALPDGWGSSKFIEWAHKGGWDLKHNDGEVLIFTERQPSAGLWPFPFPPRG